jgi:hypothetical protein
MEIQKIPMLLCNKCGSFRVINTNKGIECEDCDNKTIINIKINNEVEYLIYQQMNKETSDETF